MLKQLYDLAERLLGMTRDIRANKTGIEKLEGQVETLSEAVRGLAFELRRLRENEVHEREKMTLRLENALLLSERRMLSAGVSSSGSAPASSTGSSPSSAGSPSWPPRRRDGRARSALLRQARAEGEV